MDAGPLGGLEVFWRRPWNGDSYLGRQFQVDRYMSKTRKNSRRADKKEHHAFLRTHLNERTKCYSGVSSLQSMDVKPSGHWR